MEKIQMICVFNFSLMVNCQYQKRRHRNPGIESGSTASGAASVAASMQTRKDVEEDPPPQYELPPSYMEAVTKSIFIVQQARNEKLSKL